LILTNASGGGLWFPSIEGLAPPPDIHHRARAPSFFRIPELDASNPAAIAGKVNDTGSASVCDSLSNRKISVAAVLEVNNNSLEFNRTALDAKLKTSKTPAVGHHDSIVIVSSVNSRLADILKPSLIPSTRVFIVNLLPAGAAKTSQSIEIHVWTRAPTALGIPELDASDSAMVTGEVNLPRPPPFEILSRISMSWSAPFSKWTTTR